MDRLTERIEVVTDIIRAAKRPRKETKPPQTTSAQQTAVDTQSPPNWQPVYLSSSDSGDDNVKMWTLIEKIQELRVSSQLLFKLPAEGYAMLRLRKIANADLDWISTYQCEISLYTALPCETSNLIQGFDHGRSSWWHTDMLLAYQEAVLDLLHRNAINTAAKENKGHWRQSLIR
jgi:hypothetical protein